MLRFGEREIGKEKLHASKKPIEIWDVSFDNIVISKLVKAKTNCKYLIGYSDKAIWPLVLIMPKMSGYVKTFKVEDRNNELMPFRIDVEELLERYKSIWTRFEDSKNLKSNALPVYDDRHIKTKIRTYRDKVYTNFHDIETIETFIYLGGNLFEDFIL